MDCLFGMESQCVIIIDKELKNSNDGQSRHWGSSVRERKQWVESVESSWVQSINGTEYAFGDYYCGASPLQKQGLLVTRHLGKGQRFWDPDSVLRGNAKQLIDTLVEKGVMRDDSTKYLEFVIGVQDDSNRDSGPYTTVEVFSR